MYIKLKAHIVRVSAEFALTSLKEELKRMREEAVDKTAEHYRYFGLRVKTGKFFWQRRPATNLEIIQIAEEQIPPVEDANDIVALKNILSMCEYVGDNGYVYVGDNLFHQIESNLPPSSAF